MLVWHVADGKYAEVRQSGLGADRGELRDDHYYFVAGKLVWPGLDLGKLGIQTRLSVFCRITLPIRHIPL
jgi:hypothetical protein